MAPTILVVCDDLFFWARIEGAARALDRSVERVRDLEAAERRIRDGAVRRVLVDLSASGLDVLACARRWKAVAEPPELVAFGSHVDEAALAAARAAGFDRVLARSRFTTALPSLLGDSSPEPR